MEPIRAKASPDTESKGDLSDRAAVDRYVTRIIVRTGSIDIELREPTLAPEPLPSTADPLAQAKLFAPNSGGKAGLATHRPFRGEAGFTGIPPDGETRFVSNEVVFQAPSNVLVQVVDATARRLGLVAVSSQSLTCRAARCSTRIDNAAAASGWPDPFNL